MSNWDKRYTDRVQLLVGILPVLAREPRFALKGGTAIFEGMTAEPTNVDLLLENRRRLLARMTA